MRKSKKQLLLSLIEYSKGTKKSNGGMTMYNISLDQLKKFCSTEVYDKSFAKQLFSVGNYVCATDKCIIVATLDEKESSNHQQLADTAKKNILKYFQNRLIKQLSVADIETALNSIPKIDEILDVECTECEGSGVVEYVYNSRNGFEYTEMFECPICGGIGGESKATGNKIYPYSACISIDGLLFKANYFKRIVNLFHKIGITEVGYCIIGDALKLSADNIVIILMRMLSSDGPVGFIKSNKL